MNEYNPFLHVLSSYAQAARAKDVNAFSALYDPDVHIFDMWGSWSLQGLQAWREVADDWFLSLGDETVVVTFTDEKAVVVGELAIGHAILTYTAVAPDGTELRSLSNRATMALRKTGECWKIFHEHTSAPIDPQSLQAILRSQD